MIHSRAAEDHRKAQMSADPAVAGSMPEEAAWSIRSPDG